MSRYLCFLLSCFSATAATYYVDSGRTSSGDGSADSPWKLLSDINWTTVSNSTLTSATTLYLSSRGTWNPPGQEITPHAMGNASFRFTISGDQFYNLVASGTASWLAEAAGSRATLTGGANFTLPASGAQFFTLRGLYFDSAIYSAVFMLSPGPAVSNVFEVSTYNCACAYSTNGHGYAGDNMTASCSNILVSGCQFSNTIGEAIYIGRFDDLIGNVRGVVIESNLLVNCGQPGHEGDIDIKPPATGAIVRYNTSFHSSHTLQAPFCGVVVGANNCEVYGNVFHGAETNESAGWGVGIFINADGDGSTGKAVTSCLIYNNLIYDCENVGIKIIASSGTAGADISGVKLWNNTVWGNWVNGLSCSASGGNTITIAALTNNIFGGNTNYDVVFSTGVTLSGVDYNLYYRAAGNCWQVAGAGKTWAQWQALGYDAHGANVDPVFVSTSNFQLQVSSPAINTGATVANFSTDLLQGTRGAVWDIGAYEFVTAAVLTNHPAIKPKGGRRR